MTSVFMQHFRGGLDRILQAGADLPQQGWLSSSSMVYRREIVAHRGILARRDGEPSETKRRKQEGLSTMITSREIRLKSRPVGMPSADKPINT